VHRNVYEGCSTPGIAECFRKYIHADGEITSPLTKLMKGMHEQKGKSNLTHEGSCLHMMGLLRSCIGSLPHGRRHGVRLSRFCLQVERQGVCRFKEELITAMTLALADFEVMPASKACQLPVNFVQRQGGLSSQRQGGRCVAHYARKRSGVERNH
jgi:hypothetical protein